MRIDVVTDRLADERRVGDLLTGDLLAGDRGDSGTPAPGPAEEIVRRALLRELADRGVEPVLLELPGPGVAPVPRQLAGTEDDDGRNCVPGVHSAAAAGPAPEALLLAGTGGAMEAGTTAAWLEAARAAVRGGRRVAISGLALDDRAEPAPGLAELLAAACFVGARDEISRAVAAQLCPGHPTLRTGWDDALLVPRGPAGACGRTGASPRVVAVLDHPSGPFGPEEAAPVPAALLDALVHRTGASVTLAPATGAERDARFCAAVAARLPEDVRGTVVAPDQAVEALRSGAEHVVTTSRDALALALPVGSYVLPVAWTSYADRSMQALLDRWGLVEHVVPLAALLTPGEVAWDARAAVQQWAAEAVEGRAAVRAALLDAAPAVAAASALWWDGVVEALRGGRPRDLPASSLPPRGVGAPVARALRRRYAVPAAVSTTASPATTAEGSTDGGPGANTTADAAGNRAAPAARTSVAVVVLARCGPGAPGPAESLRRILDGLLQQTFTDWRVVVVGAGTGAGGLGTGYRGALPAGLRLGLAGRASLVGGRALGAGAAANLGLRAVDAEFVVVLDGGAAAAPWPPTLLQRAVAHLEDPLIGDDGVVVRTEESGPGGGHGARTSSGPGEAPGAGPAALTLVELLRGHRGLPGPFLYRRAVHDVLGDRDETLTGAEEWEFALRFLETFTVGLLPGAGPVRPRRSAAGVPPGTGGAELVVRERLLKQWTAEHGIGLPLHLGRTIEEQAEALHGRLDDSEALTRELLAVVRAQADRLEELERLVASKGVAAFCRRMWQALTGR